MDPCKPNIGGPDPCGPAALTPMMFFDSILVSLNFAKLCLMLFVKQ